MSVEVKLRKGEAMEKALRRLKKKLDREGVIRDVRQKRYYEKPCEIKRRKNKVAAFNNMLFFCAFAAAREIQNPQVLPILQKTNR